MFGFILLASCFVSACRKLIERIHLHPLFWVPGTLPLRRGVHSRAPGYGHTSRRCWVCGRWRWRSCPSWCCPGPPAPSSARTRPAPRWLRPESAVSASLWWPSRWRSSASALRKICTPSAHTQSQIHFEVLGPTYQILFSRYLLVQPWIFPSFLHLSWGLSAIQSWIRIPNSLI